MRESDHRMSGLSRETAAVVVGTAMLLIAVAFDGRPTVFTDTDDYFTQGRAVTRAVEGFVADGRLPFRPDEAWARLTDPKLADEEPIHNQNGARSGYYGALLFVLQRAGTLWALAGVQCLLAAWLIHRLWRATTPGAASRRYLAMMAGLATASALPVFAGFAMPDVFAGFAVISAMLLLLYGDRIGRRETVALWGVLAAAANFHGSNALIVLALAGAAGLLLWRAGTALRVIAGRVGLIVAAVALATAAGSVYGLIVKMRSGDALRRPPFLMARVLADGPGRRALRSACGRGERLALCAYRALPLTDSEDILWSDDPDLGVFNVADFRTRERLEREETRFVVSAVAADPLGQVSASLGNALSQMLAVEVDEPVRDPAYYLTDPYWAHTNLPSLVLAMGGCGPGNLDCKPRLSAPWIVGAQVAAALAGVGTALWAALAAVTRGDLTRLPGRWDEARTRFAAVCALVLLALVVNAGVCGALSGAFARYQARIVWLGPLAGLLALSAAPGRRNRAGPGGVLPATS